MAAGMVDMTSNSVYLSLWNEIRWFIEWWAITRRTPMSVMEITVHCNMNITAIFQRSSKRGAAKARWAALDENLST